MELIRTIVNFSRNSALLLVGTAVGGTTIAALIAREFGLDLPEFPATIIGLYETFRYYVFYWTNWLPFSWPTWLSDVITLYLAIGFAIMRGDMLSAQISGGPRPPGYTSHWWDRFTPIWTTPEEYARYEAINTIFGWPGVIVSRFRENAAGRKTAQRLLDKTARRLEDNRNRGKSTRRARQGMKELSNDLTYMRWNLSLVAFSMVSVFFFSWILLQWEVAQSLVFP